MADKEELIFLKPVQLDVYQICADLGINTGRLKEFLLENKHQDHSRLDIE